jgi:hypothetical protein
MKKTATAIAQRARYSWLVQSFAPHSVQTQETNADMNAHEVDYSLVLGVFSAVVGLCVILTVWYAAKTLWKTHRRAQHERQWRRAKGF